MQQIKVRIPRASNIRTIIRKTYRDLYDARKAAMPDDSAYTRKQLEQNIQNASAINGKIVSDIDIKNSSFEEWASRGWKQLYHFHWYFAVTLNRARDGEIVAVVQDAHYEGEHHNDTLTSQPYDESQIRKGKIVLSESDIRKMVRECICKIIQEQHPKEYQLGKYKCVDGDWWDGVPHGLESKCCYIQDVRMYDSIEETIGLFRRCDNLKYFYAKIVPDKGKETKWQAMKLSEVPIVIRNDFSTINSSGHEPYLPF